MPTTNRLEDSVFCSASSISIWYFCRFTRLLQQTKIQLLYCETDTVRNASYKVSVQETTDTIVSNAPKTTKSFYKKMRTRP